MYSLFPFFYPEKPHFLTIMRKISKFKPNSILRRRNFIETVKRIGVKIRLYTKYIKAGETCVVNREFDLYTRYFKKYEEIV